MRISENEATQLKSSIMNELPGAKVYLFGSRADDSKKGGDIDVLVIAHRKLRWNEKGRVRNNFY